MHNSREPHIRDTEGKTLGLSFEVLLLVRCFPIYLEEIAYKQGWINKEQLLKLAQPMIKNGYGQYLIHLAEDK